MKMQQVLTEALHGMSLGRNPDEHQKINRDKDNVWFKYITLALISY